MTKDEIFSLAREAGLDIDTTWGAPNVTVMRFATLVAEKEREQLMNEPLTKEMWQRFEDEIRASEREACAKVCEESASYCNHPFHREALESGAFAIRARGTE